MSVSWAPAPATATRAILDTMRAAVLFGPRDLWVVEKPVRVPRPADVLVKVATCVAAA